MMNVAIAMDVTAAPATASATAEAPEAGEVAFSEALAELVSDEVPEEESSTEAAQLIAGAWLFPTVPPEVRAAETPAPTVASIDPGVAAPATELAPRAHAAATVEPAAPEIAISVESAIASAVVDPAIAQEPAPEPPARPELPPGAIEFVFEPPPRSTSTVPTVAEVAPVPELMPVEERGHLGLARAEIVLGDGRDAIALRVTIEGARDQIVRVEAVAPPTELAALQQDTAGLRAALRRHGLDLGGFSTSARREQDAPERERPERDAERAKDEPIAIHRPGLRVVI